MERAIWRSKSSVGTEEPSVAMDLGSKPLEEQVKQMRVLLQPFAEIVFRPNEVDLTVDAEAQIRQVAKLLKVCPMVKVMVEGHIGVSRGLSFKSTPEKSNEDDAKELSRVRAEVVRASLRKEIPNRVSCQPFGFLNRKVATARIVVLDPNDKDRVRQKRSKRRNAYCMDGSEDANEPESPHGSSSQSPSTNESSEKYPHGSMQSEQSPSTTSHSSPSKSSSWFADKSSRRSKSRPRDKDAYSSASSQGSTRPSSPSSSSRHRYDLQADGTLHRPCGRYSSPEDDSSMSSSRRRTPRTPSIQRRPSEDEKRYKTTPIRSTNANYRNGHAEVWSDRRVIHPADHFKPGMKVIVIEDFGSDNIYDRVMLKKGQVGQVLQVDNDGDAKIDFLDHKRKGWQWVMYRNLDKLELLGPNGFPHPESTWAQISNVQVEDAEHMYDMLAPTTQSPTHRCSWSLDSLLGFCQGSKGTGVSECPDAAVVACCFAAQRASGADVVPFPRPPAALQYVDL